MNFSNQDFDKISLLILLIFISILVALPLLNLLTSTLNFSHPCSKFSNTSTLKLPLFFLILRSLLLSEFFKLRNWSLEF